MNDPNQTVDEPGRDSGSPVPAVPGPTHIGRYRIERLLGQGGFGLVYLAHDEQLRRLVAIKVPHPERVERPEDAEAYLTEARTVASLDHPHIVPVYDVGSTPECPCFVVSKYIDGTDLATRFKQGRLSLHEAVELVATVAEALHHAHKQGLVHRDIKPGNILLDRSGKPFVADFGLALREQDVGKGPRNAGTPVYMSPEQARGEGHRVDGRSDIFSLGVVFYELLTGRRPFKAESQSELLEQITSGEARPPRQVDDTIPRELDRICLKALTKRASERFSAARDLADDLRSFLSSASVEEKSTLTGRGKQEPEVSTPLLTPTPPPGSDGPPVKIVPKGLRSFDAADADFFLELLPGARDRDGLPDSIRFWKTRTEAIEADGTFAVGLIYGPSGCGKSSLVKAGLLPRLAKAVTAVYVEATGEETEVRLLKGLRRQLPDLPGNLSLGESLAGLRRGRYLEPSQKVLLVLDQFEQWLHAQRTGEATELVQALRQCDGGRVQAIVLVRDDFWLAVSRFMKALEVEILEGRNSALVDLFDPLHARKVLAAFGRAYGRLPDNLGERTKEQDAFLDQAVAGLAQDGKVISVRLALFAEMVKGKPWTPTTLREVGGTEGVGVTFLEETFTASTAPPQHRLHQKAAQAVLQALLPESGTDIKGHMRSQQELLETSGYGGRPKDFDDLVRILDREIRLVTPTDPEGKEDPDSSNVQAGGKYFQLTHDYLVPSLRDWLTRKQKETRRGRAELLLADRAAVWNARSENRQLPSLAQWLSIRWLTRKRAWTPPQRRMMGRAARFHALRALLLAVVLVLAGAATYEVHGRYQAHSLRAQLLRASTAEVPGIVENMGPYRRWLDPLLVTAHDEAEAQQNRRQQLHASLALLKVQPGRKDYLCERLLDADPSEVAVLRQFLEPYQEELRDRLWGAAEHPARGHEGQRLRAACALADYDPDSPRWAAVQDPVANDLVAVPAVYLATWIDALRPIRGRLRDPLAVNFRDGKRPETERSLAAAVLADYAADQPELLTDLLSDAEPRQYAVLLPVLERQRERSVPSLRAELARTVKPGGDDAAREKLAKRQANAAVALLQLGAAEAVWPLLRHQPDPRLRSYLVHRFSPLAADPHALVQRLGLEADTSVRRALLLALGEFGPEALPVAEREGLLPVLRQLYREDADPGLHAAAEWLLRKWQQDAWLKETGASWVKDRTRREERVKDIARQLATARDRAPRWYVTGQGQTMVVIPQPRPFLMGSPPGEAGRRPNEVLHVRRIGRSFAIASTPVTVAQFRRYLEANPKVQTAFEARGQAAPLLRHYSPEEDCPIVLISWYLAAGYCNWLSEQEGIRPEQWCYEPAPGAGYGRGMKLKAKYLSLEGYRLPTEAEWEYACRAGAATSRYYGETEELLGEYAWYLGNAHDRTGPVGSRKPNDLGLSDTHGNVWNWCQEQYADYPDGSKGQPREDEEGTLSIDNQQGRVLRGGSFLNNVVNVRSAYRNIDVPATRNVNLGFRPARTFR